MVHYGPAWVPTSFDNHALNSVCTWARPECTLFVELRKALCAHSISLCLRSCPLVACERGLFHGIHTIWGIIFILYLFCRLLLKEIRRLRDEHDEASKSAAQIAQNPELLAELKLLRQRKDELEMRMSALQESRRELMVQLEGLMNLLKVSSKASDSIERANQAMWLHGCLYSSLSSSSSSSSLDFFSSSGRTSYYGHPWWFLFIHEQCDATLIQ